MKSRLILIALTIFCLSCTSAEESNIGWREDFNSSTNLNSEDWRIDGGKLFTPATTFKVAKDVLEIRADKSTGILMVKPKVSLREYPIMRWRWRVKNLPPKGDGRTKLDDQALAIYIGFGGTFSRKALSYRWETEMPQGEWSKTTYGGGTVDVNFLCLRNKSCELNIWYDEERDIAKDIIKFYGQLPPKNDYTINIGANSQYTKSNTYAELDYIELVKRPTIPKDITPIKTENVRTQ